MITLINCFFTAWYLITITTTKKATGLDTFGLMYYNNILSLPVVLCIVYFLEMDQIQNFHGWRDPYFLVLDYILKKKQRKFLRCLFIFRPAFLCPRFKPFY